MAKKKYSKWFKTNGKFDHLNDVSTEIYLKMLIAIYFHYQIVYPHIDA